MNQIDKCHSVSSDEAQKIKFENSCEIYKSFSMLD